MSPKIDKNQANWSYDKKKKKNSSTPYDKHQQ